MIEEYREDVICELIHKIFDASYSMPRSKEAKRCAQVVLEKQLGIVGIERREELYSLLQECWYRIAQPPYPNIGYFANGDELLVKMEKMLVGCNRDVHVNHCCNLGLVYRKNREDG